VNSIICDIDRSEYCVKGIIVASLSFTSTEH
jgi:hypothetical protein